MLADLVLQFLWWNGSKNTHLKYIRNTYYVIENLHSLLAAFLLKKKTYNTPISYD